MNISGGEAIAKMLKEEGVEVVFGIPDGTYFGLFTTLRNYGIKIITPRHEQCGVHAAGAYSKLTGKVGVCIASNGPGVAAALSGIAVEDTEGHRVMFITSSRRPEIIYPNRGGAYQVFDHTGVIRPMAKYSEAVKSHDRIFEVVRQAFRKTWQGRPGVVHIDVPENIMNGKFKFNEAEFLEPKYYRNTTPMEPTDDAVTKAAQLLINARFPVVHAGSGIIHARAFEELELVANILQAPVTTSWAARGSLCEGNTLSVPLTAIELTNDLRREADLILCLGSRIGETDWWGKMPNWGSPYEQKMIQVDLDEEIIGRNKPVTLGVQADVKVFLRKVYDKLKTMEDQVNKTSRKDIYNAHMVKGDKARAKIDEHLKDMASPMNSAHVAVLCQKAFPKKSVAIFDGGNTAVWAQFFYKCTNNASAMGTPKMGMLGAGPGQAIGAAVARPDEPVYCITGDGAFGYHTQEVETAVRNNLNITFLVLCDLQWGMVKINQQFALKPIKTIMKKDFDETETVNTDFGEIKFDKLAESMGAWGTRVNSPAGLEDALSKAAPMKGCKVIHIDVDPLKHMWAPALRTFKKMHEEPKGK
jgi:acetolactate synthase I/II/III large subunit